MKKCIFVTLSQSESESLKYELEYTVGLKHYITGKIVTNLLVLMSCILILLAG